MRLREVERWISVVRLAAFPFVLAPVAAASYPAGWERWAWVTTGGFALGSLALFALARSEVGGRHAVAQSVIGQLFDTAVVTGYVLVFVQLRGGNALSSRSSTSLPGRGLRALRDPGRAPCWPPPPAPIVFGFEQLRVDQLHLAYSWKLIDLQTGLETLIALIVGWLVRRLVLEGGRAEERAQEAETLRDEFAGRVDRADAAYESARVTVEELRRLSSLRAGNFVSLDRLARGAHADGGGHRVGADATGALARAERRPA